jgi:hypothetical protein
MTLELATKVLEELAKKNAAGKLPAEWSLNLEKTQIGASIVLSCCLMAKVGVPLQRVMGTLMGSMLEMGYKLRIEEEKATEEEYRNSFGKVN